MILNDTTMFHKNSAIQLPVPVRDENVDQKFYVFLH